MVEVRKHLKPHQTEIAMAEAFENAAKQETPMMPDTRF